ncbi:MAG: anthranilate synthase component I [Phycisphaerales bacterium]|nr:anthranilate synthase component I [Phycisphaerales bacterium]
MAYPDKEQCVQIVRAQRSGGTHAPDATLVIPICVSLLDDQLTPVLAYRRLVAPDARTAPSFLLESVEGGDRQGRHSILGAQPTLEIIAHQHTVRILDHRAATNQPEVRQSVETDPLDVARRMSANLVLVMPAASTAGAGGRGTLPKCFLGGWVGFAAYDTVRYAEPEKLAWNNAPKDDRQLPDLHLAYYDGVVVFDHVDKLVHVIKLLEIPPGASDEQVIALHENARRAIDRRLQEMQTHSEPMTSGRMPGASAAKGTITSNITPLQHAEMLAKAKEYIKAGDIFQVVLGQRFERRSRADPFDVYRALRAVNPSPYMVYMQCEGCILVASSPEILCRVRRQQGERIVTNRPLAGTRKRGTTPEEDLALERDLLADPKELAEHVMLVDLGRNDVGQVAKPGSIKLPAMLTIERYSHVMHISSTVTGALRDDVDCWDALRAALPVGTISGAPKIRAMQIIDELEPIRRGPYGGGMGYVGLDGDMDIALALRTMVVPVARRSADGEWVYHLQAAGGIVADSETQAEFQETVNKAAALARAIDVAEAAFG